MSSIESDLGGKPSRGRNQEEFRSRERQLVAEARRLFSKGGYNETTLQEIADQLGITRPLFYYYFKSKNELLWQVIGQIGQELVDKAQPIVESGEPAGERLRMLHEVHAEVIVTNWEGYRVYFAERHLVEGKRDRMLRAGERQYQASWEQVIVAGQEERSIIDGDPEVLAKLGVGCLNSVVRWFDPALHDPLEVRRLAVAMSLRGLLA